SSPRGPPSRALAQSMRSIPRAAPNGPTRAALCPTRGWISPRRSRPRSPPWRATRARSGRIHTPARSRRSATAPGRGATRPAWKRRRCSSPSAGRAAMAKRLLDIVLAAGDPETAYVERLLPLKVALDVVYVRHASLPLDVRIIGRTLTTVGACLGGRRRFRDPPEAPAARALLDLERMTCDTNG